MDDDPDAALERAAAPSVLATAVTTVTDPALVIALLLVAVALSGPGPLLVGAGWATFIATTVVGVPSALVWFLVRRGRITDHRIIVRRQRILPMAVAIGCAAASLVTLWWFGAAPQLTALVVCVLVGTVVGATVNHWTKVSVHSSVMATTAVITGVQFGLVTGATVAVAALLTAWSRVRLGRHTHGQVLLGLLLGTVVGALTYPPLS